ncbi:MAG TPA: hypothetical protein VH092_27685 [Urbifossiella sp.]|nr:hypothetical protein [Urbifossiella sp.]
MIRAGIGRGLILAPVDSPTPASDPARRAEITGQYNLYGTRCRQRPRLRNWVF